MKITACSVVGLLIVCGGAIAQQKTAAGGDDEAALRALEEKWDTANLKGDTVALGAIFADTFISTNNEGKVRTKAEVLAQVKSGEVKYQASRSDDMKVLVYGDAAVVNGRWKGKSVEKGKTVDTNERFTDTYVRQNGQWRCVASHGSTIK
jgi:ketosteroid isomerase-like protein